MVHRKPNATNPAGLTTWPDRTFDWGSREFHETSDEAVLEWIRQVVQVESPIHIEETALRVATAAGLQRAGTRIRARVRGLAQRGDVGGLFRMKGDFLWRTEQERVEFRRRATVSFRADCEGRT